eukprot:1142261-Pelagomonas_calceolata.AAC.13
MARLFQASLPHLRTFSTSDLSWLLMSCASLSAHPPRPWMEGLLQASQARMQEASPSVSTSSPCNPSLPSSPWV